MKSQVEKKFGRTSDKLVSSFRDGTSEKDAANLFVKTENL